MLIVRLSKNYKVVTENYLLQVKHLEKTDKNI